MSILTVEDLKARCVRNTTHCWLWQGATASDGTPRIHTLCHASMDKRTLSGPKAAWNIAFGQAPRGLVFRCCQQRACLNPAHLRQARDRAEIGQHIRRLGSRKGTAVAQRRANQRVAMEANGLQLLPDAAVREIRAAPKSVNNKTLGKQYGVAHQTISRIRLMQSYRHLPEAA